MVKPIYKGTVVTLNVDTVRLPNGHTIDLEVIRHPGASAVVPMKEDGTVVLIRQFRHAANGFIYEIPAGKLHPKEDPLDCAARELEEEIGYKAGRFELLSSIFTAPGFADEVIHIYLATGLTIGTQNLDQDEVLEVVEMPLREAISKIEDGTIRDGKTIVGLQAVYIRQERYR
ncbi:ADP-ribose pyrophosphatase [Nitrospira defluvii]|jgi:ADP-ribose pyrophosphatase|uniref:GDP-mannose pyrophosphatase n=1 Tax=Nitrospira defluvii TaxID=330214 RepID=D8PA39_9BACT|nr:ADP-ribose pyrophosphatase [Nitrospira defluvii]